jgi:hypothetical protein
VGGIGGWVDMRGEIGVSVGIFKGRYKYRGAE